MRLKSYFAGTVESAICLARQEMGEDAMLVNSRKAPQEARHLGAYEVVFASAPDAREEIGGAAARKAEEPAPLSTQSLLQEMTEMRRQVAKVSAQVSRTATRGRPGLRGPASPALDDIDEALVAQEIEGGLACSLLRNLESLPPTATFDQAWEALRQELRSRLTVAPELSPWSNEAPGRTIAALVGPPGAGKTAMLAKLAVRHGLAAKRSTHIISYDSHRIASGEPLRSYAAILGVGFEALDTVTALAHSLKENSRKELILIDTPGYSAADFDLSYDLSEFLSTYPHVDIHLVLSCAARSSDLTRMVDRYNKFNPAKLIFTRLDETESRGAILNESIRTGLPVSFLGSGPRVPDDLEPAEKDRIIDLLFGEREFRAVASA
jgi:flagellar biosynthesis protein FlhF